MKWQIRQRKLSDLLCWATRYIPVWKGAPRPRSCTRLLTPLAGPLPLSYTIRHLEASIRAWKWNVHGVRFVTIYEVRTRVRLYSFVFITEQEQPIYNVRVRGKKRSPN